MSVFLNLVAFMLMVGGILVWIWVVNRLFLRQSVLPYEPRRQVPWEGIDVLIILFTAVLLQTECIYIGLKLAGVTSWDSWNDLDAHAKFVSILADLISRFLTLILGVLLLVFRTRATAKDLGINPARTGYDFRCGALAFLASLPLVYGVQAVVIHWIEYEHQIIDVVQTAHTPATYIVTAISAIIAAPLVEEFLFRVLLQGWLEKLELCVALRLRPAALLKTNISPVNQISETMPTDSAATREPPKHGLFGLPLGVMPILTSSALFAITHFRDGTESAWLRLFAVAPLFVFGVFLGFVYQRTHRLLPSLTIHILLNAMTMASLFAGG
jgi:membrane protease YdiL (CAAX protease family)